MQLGILYNIRTDPAVDFQGAIAGTAAITASITPEGFLGRRFRLTNLVIVSKEAIDWELSLWGKSIFDEAVVADNFLKGYWQFQAAYAKQIPAATGLYYYFIPGLDVFYEDDEWAASSQGPNPSAPRVHMMLRGAGKSAGASGQVLINLQVDPCLGY